MATPRPPPCIATTSPDGSAHEVAEAEMVDRMAPVMLRRERVRRELDPHMMWSREIWARSDMSLNVFATHSTMARGNTSFAVRTA